MVDFAELAKDILGLNYLFTFSYIMIIIRNFQKIEVKRNGIEDSSTSHKTEAENIVNKVDRLTYTGKAPPLMAEEIESLLRKNNIARICSHNKDGTIHAAAVNYVYKNGQIVIGSIASSRKTKNIKRNNNVTVLIDTESAQGILIYGKAGLEYDNVYQEAVSVWEQALRAPRDKVERLVQAYLDKVKYVIVKITPQRIVTYDYTKDDVFNNLVKTYI